MKVALFIIILVSLTINQSIGVNSYNRYNNTIDSKFEKRNQILKHQILVSEIGLNKLEIQKNKLPPYWFPFICGAVGTYFIYTAGLGLVAFAIIYFIKKGQKKAIIKAALGCITGMVLGGMLKLIILNLNN